ncbi:MAG: hypothetical protein CVU57_12920, partial [Deltaproteobacteria bacterium HGW-Deltaproteobacteria-15]
MKKDQAGWNWVHFWVALLSFLLIAPPYLFAMPQGAQVQSGQARISQPDLNNMHITQGTNKAIINWQSFSIGRPEAVRFFQPSSSSIALNRVVGGNPSEIYGLLSANGRIYLINTNGIMVGPTGQINVNSFIASTLGISNEDFLQGNNVFTQSVGKSLASIVNQGAITAADGGFVSLIAPSVQNQGTITANLGKVFIGGGERVTLNFDGENLISFAIEEEVKGVVLDQEGNPAEAIINNQGTISADGGEVILSAKSAIDSIKSVVNNDGVIAAKSLVNENGVIKLMGGDEGVVANSGTLDASGKVAGAKGGTVQVLGDKVGLFGDGLIDVSGDAGGGTVLVGGDFQGKNPSIMNASRTYVSPEFSIKADALTNGDGGRVIVWSDEVTRFYGDISARGGALGGDGGFVEISGKENLGFYGDVDTIAVNGIKGTLLLDPQTILIKVGDNTIYNGTDDLTADGVWDLASDPALAGEIGDGHITTLLTSNQLRLEASESISIADGVSIDLANKLTLDAGTDLSFQGSATFTGAGGLELIAGGAISQAGVGAISVASSLLTLTAGTNITLNNLGNDFGTVAITSGVNVDIADANDIDLGLSTATGNLDVTAGAGITQDVGTILTVAGATDLTAGTDIVL